MHAMKTFGIYEIKTHLSQVCEDVAETGESVLVTRRGRPFVRIDPVEPSLTGRSEVWEARERFLAGQDLEYEIPDIARTTEGFTIPFSDNDT